jgi:very-short-patch-repair endonuclease
MPGLSYVPNALLRVARRTRELDVLVNFRGRSCGWEIDGPHHTRPVRYAADLSRTLLMEDAGLMFVRRIVVDETNDERLMERRLRDGVLRLTLPTAA